MKTKNFPGRKNRRRQGALDRLKDGSPEAVAIEKNISENPVRFTRPHKRTRSRGESNL